MFEDFEKKLNDKLKNAINDSLEVLKKSIDDKTPEDTKKLLWQTRTEQAKISWEYIIWKVINDNTEYWVYVEYWVNRDFNYHKPKWSIFYTWTWSRMVTRWFDDTKEKIITNIKKCYE